MCVYISLSINQNAIVLSPTKALNQTIHKYWITEISQIKKEHQAFTISAAATKLL
jgi:hypothetical protein